MRLPYLHTQEIFFVKGVQHPPPGLRCSAFRTRPEVKSPRRIVVTAPHATAVFDDKRLTQPSAGDPRTRIWALLYAQVTQVDGASRRNVLLARAPAIVTTTRGIPAESARPQTRDVVGVAQFDEDDIKRQLADLGLPSDSPLSVVAVELLPGDRLVMRTATLGDAQVFFVDDLPDLPASVTTTALGAVAGVAALSDPLGAELGTIASRRILRCSPLTPVAPAC